MGQLLQRSSPAHLSIDLVEALKGLATTVEASPELHTQVLGRLLLDLRLFSRAEAATQNHLLRYYAYLSKVVLSSLIKGENDIAPFCGSVLHVGFFEGRLFAGDACALLQALRSSPTPG